MKHSYYSLISPRLYLFVSLLCMPWVLEAQTMQSPAKFLGYELGEAFTYHHRMVDYFEHIGKESVKVSITHYGTTSERRPLIAAFISSPENIVNLEEYRKSNLGAIGMGEATSGVQKPFVWLSYNIHGNESVSMETAMKLLYELAEGKDNDMQEWLKEVIVVIDPCENPDGRDRYANWYNQAVHKHRSINGITREHQEPWPGGRFNHYLFDLNRDWAWQTQVESRQRIAFYQKYMPHIHVDLHEMGYNTPYFFGPSAEPFHKSITNWQREFHRLAGPNHAKYFDPKGWLYFTKETYDLFYPSYGDTWPIFNGSMGFTYEQGGGGGAGLAVKTEEGDTLTLTDRINHHYATSISTIELGYVHRDRLIKEFNQYFNEGGTSPDGDYRSYVIKGNANPNRLKAIMDLLGKQQIRYGIAQSSDKKGGFSGFDYLRNKPGSFSVEAQDIIVSAYQPQHHLIKVLFEPKPVLVDSMTYDMTAWALPYVYGLEAYATDARIGVKDGNKVEKEVLNKVPSQKPYAYLALWGDLANVKFLAALLKKGMKPRYSDFAFKAKGITYPPGSLIITQGDNRYIADFDKELVDLANKHEQLLGQTPSGLVEQGKDFGSNDVHLIKAPRVAVICGEGVSPTSYGEIWHFFEQQIEYPIASINAEEIIKADLSAFDVLILPNGKYTNHTDKLKSFARNGGKVIALDGALKVFEGDGTKLAMATKERDDAISTHNPLLPYGERQRNRISYGVEGSIYRVHLDLTHPLAYGMSEYFFLPKRNNKVYPYLPKGGWNVGVYKSDSHIAGFVGSKLKPQIPNSLAIGVETMGEGKVIYFPDSPIFRGFWHIGMVMMGNAVFLVK